MSSGIWFTFSLITMVICVCHVYSQSASCLDPCFRNPCRAGERCVQQQVQCDRDAPVCCPVSRCVPRGNKPGSCPYVPPGTVGTCQIACRSDRDCAGNLKCCSNGCGVVCRNPVSTY